VESTVRNGGGSWPTDPWLDRSNEVVMAPQYATRAWR
jgi:hypothetical protein